MDVLSSSADDSSIVWYENDGNGNFTTHVISTSVNGADHAFAADVDGTYEEANLDVEIRPGGPGTQVVVQVATGRVTFGVTNADRVLVGQFRPMAWNL